MELGEDEPPDGGGVKCQKLKKLKRSADPNTSDIIKKNLTPAASIQNIYIHPDFSDNSKLMYTANDKAPFFVVVSNSESSSPLRALDLAQLLHKNKINNIANGGIKSLGRNKVSIEFKSADAANNFINIPFLKIHKLLVSIPTYHITRMGILQQVPLEWTLEELVLGLQSPENCGPVIRARRLNRKIMRDGKTDWVPSSSVVLTFQGQNLPNHIYCYNHSMPVQIYHQPIIQCRNCCFFGHTATQCRSKPRCYKCSESHHASSCNIQEVDARCLFCSGKHTATYPGCPEHLRQKQIKLVMSEENISFIEASARFKKVKTSYADISKSSSAPSPVIPSVTNTHSRPQSHSYVKTYFTSPRPKTNVGISYDKNFHQNLTSTPSSSFPNGHCLSSNPSSHALPKSSETAFNIVDFLITSITNILHSYSIDIPDSIITILRQFIIQYASPKSNNTSVEC